MQRSHLVHGACEQKRAPGPSVYTIFVSSRQSTALFLLLSACFKMVSDRANTGPFCAGTQALVPSTKYGQPLILQMRSLMWWRLKMCLKTNRSVKTRDIGLVCMGVACSRLWPPEWYRQCFWELQHVFSVFCYKFGNIFYIPVLSWV